MYVPEELQVIRAPVVPSPGASVIYSITLANGYVVTSPAGFGEATPAPSAPVPGPAPTQ